MALTLHTADVVLPVGAPPMRDGAVLVDGEHIAAVGSSEQCLSGSDRAAVRVRSWPGILTPGLVNAHAHLQYGPAFADLADGTRPFASWIGELTSRRRAMAAGGWREQVSSSWQQALSTGTTSVADVVSNVEALGVTVEGVRYIESVGLPSRLWSQERARLVRLLAAEPSLGLSPHTLYTLGTDVVRGVIALAREHGRRLHPHLAETSDEAEFVLAGTGRFAAAAERFGFDFELAASGGSGRSPAAHLEALGGLGPDVHVAHGTHLDADDRALLRRAGTAVALCARSNALLQAGAPPVAAHLLEGSPIAVGTDSLASTPDLDLLGELRALARLARAQAYAGGDLSRRLIDAATRGGAAALGLADRGVLAPGARADLAVFACDAAGGEASNPEQALLATGRCIATVLAGEVVYESRPTPGLAPAWHPAPAD